MIIYNVTSNVDESVHDQWLIWIKTHIKEILKTKLFTKALLSRVLIEEKMGGITYSVQYTAKSEADLKTYYTEIAPTLRQDVNKLFGDKVLVYRTELEIIEEFKI